MPKYLGKGPTFYLVSCELMLPPNASFEEKKDFHERVCNDCGFFKDAMKRRDKAVKNGKGWRRLICIHPQNRAALEKWRPHVTVWGR